MNETPIDATNLEVLEEDVDADAKKDITATVQVSKINEDCNERRRIKHRSI